jgi:hypothetical protein
VGKRFVMEMEEQITPSAPAPTPAQAPVPNFPPSITPEMVEQMKARAREEAIRMTMEQRQSIPGARMAFPAGISVQPSGQPPVPPQVVYVRRNMTLAELLLTLLLACGIVTGVQFTWKAATTFLPRIQVQIK